jgi:glycine/D-amino acid oxidase-like deaminating enzyme
MPDPTQDVLVIGGGIVGVATALQLQIDGFHVTVVDPNPPASGCSAGNAGYLSEANIFPAAAMAGLRRLPAMLLDRAGPLVVRPTYLPRFLPWAMRAARAAMPDRVPQTISGLAGLIVPAIASHHALVKLAGVEHLIDQRGALVIFKDVVQLDARCKRIGQWKSYGIAVERLSREDIMALEPAISPEIVGGLFFPQSARCLDPRQLGEAYCAALIARGGTYLRRRVLKLVRNDAVGWTVGTTGGDLDFPRVVVAAGRWSDALLKPLGHRVPLESERGYHLMLTDPKVALTRPISIGEASFAATPMLGGLRLAGTAEFAGTDVPADMRRARMLAGPAKAYFPGLDVAHATPWMGVRPSLPDMLPAIGSSKHPGLYYCFGHNHNGLTQSAISARIVSDLVLGLTPAVDATPYSLDRFN